MYFPPPIATWVPPSQETSDQTETSTGGAEGTDFQALLQSLIDSTPTPSADSALQAVASTGSGDGAGGTPTPPTAPLNIIQGTGLLQADNSTLTGGASVGSDGRGASNGAYAILNGDFDGTDFARDFFDDGVISEPTAAASMVFGIEMEVAGWVTVDFRFNNTSGGNVYRDLLVNGETLPGVMVFEDQFAPDNWGNTTDRFYLEAGVNTIELSSKLDLSDPPTVDAGGTVLIDSVNVTSGVTPSDHISARSLLMNNWDDMVANHQSAAEDPEDTSIFGPELAQLRHAANWNQNQIDSGQLWLKGTTFEGETAFYGPQFDSSLYFDEHGIMNVDYQNYLPTGEELFVSIEKDYAMVPGQPLLVERYSFVNNKELGESLETWDMMARLHLPEELTQKAVWDERRETFIVELEQENGQAPLYLAFGAFQEMDAQDIEVEGTIDKTPTELLTPFDPDLLNPSGLRDEPALANQFYSDTGLDGDVTGAGEGLGLAMSTEIELYPTRPVEYYFYYTLAGDLDTLDQQISTTLNPDGSDILNSPSFWFDYTTQKWDDKLDGAVDPTQGARPIEDPALITGYERTLVSILQSQQPEFGSFVAATTPSYDFKAWPRDGAATAMGLDAAGLVDDAENYWNWMASIEEDGDGDPLFENGTFYTNYSFWNADEPIDFVQPEWDAQGLFLIGVYKHAEKLREMGLDDRASDFLNDPVMKQALIDSAEFIENNIDPDKGFGPPEFSIWESFFAYNGFTQITYASGLQAAALLADDLGISEERRQAYIDGAQTIKAAIERPITDENFPGLWNEEDGYFIWGVTPEGNPIERPNAALDLMWVTGLFDIDDPKVMSQMNYVLENLSNNEFGISRYDSDNFYAQSPFSPGGSYESFVDQTSWPQMTSYMSMGKEFSGDAEWAYNSLEWTISRYAEGFMPPGEGVDPSTREPLPSTMVEPVTGSWFLMNLLNYTDQNDTRLPAIQEQGDVFQFVEQLGNGMRDFIEVEGFNAARDSIDLQGEDVLASFNGPDGVIFLAGNDRDVFIVDGVDDIDDIAFINTGGQMSSDWMFA